MKVKNCVSAEFNSICSFVLYSSILIERSGRRRFGKRTPSQDGINAKKKKKTNIGNKIDTYTCVTLCGWQACQWHDKNTAETVLFFDRLFDSVNGAGSAKGARGKLRTAVTKKW
ncbi:uncharacterized protein LOC135117227 isoform X1 [Helicoverpa armigera]|uniref:uncharacterized protein LOC135117227 isoform X1 n=1 Tax=Helicoverpa armigera TaxID=29058 RepID=UPI003082EDA6